MAPRPTIFAETYTGELSEGSSDAVDWSMSRWRRPQVAGRGWRLTTTAPSNRCRRRAR